MSDDTHDPLRAIRENIARARAQLRGERPRPSREQVTAAVNNFNAWVERQQTLSALEKMASQPTMPTQLRTNFAERLQLYNERFFPTKG